MSTVLKCLNLCGLAITLQTLLATILFSPNRGLASENVQLSLVEAGQDFHKLASVAQPVERELAAGQRASFDVDLSSGQFMRVDVYSPGLDLMVSVIQPGGQRSS